LKPVAIFRYARTEGPGHFATFLSSHGLEWTLVALDEGEPVPADPRAYSGLGFMGGPMSANDELPWTQPVLQLMRDAVAAKVPVIGHCLGGQMLARAMGGQVSRNPVKEIGWVPVTIEDSPIAQAWFQGAASPFATFQWHEDTFTLPPGATRILTGTHCPNQAYVLDDRHLGMQCHVEITAEMIDTWCRTGISDIDENVGRSPAVQDAATIRSLIARNLTPLSATADRLYARWITNLAGRAP
jgi:GMP synthase-like glutamine amidotransferase